MVSQITYHPKGWELLSTGEDCLLEIFTRNFWNLILEDRDFQLTMMLSKQISSIIDSRFGSRRASKFLLPTKYPRSLRLLLFHKGGNSSQRSSVFYPNWFVATNITICKQSGLSISTTSILLTLQMGLKVLQSLIHDMDSLFLISSHIPLSETLLDLQRANFEDNRWIIDNNSIARNQALVSELEIGGPSEKTVPSSIK